MMMSMAVVGLFWQLLYDPSWGPLNYALGLGDFAWLSDPDVALYAVAITDIWMWSPFVMLLSLAGLSAVPQHLYEAAAIDRAGRWYTFTRITLPLVAPLLLIAIIFRTMEAFKTFDIAYIMIEPADDRADRDQALQDGVPGMADRQVLRARLHRADHGAGDHQHLREVPQPGEGALTMAAVKSHRARRSSTASPSPRSSSSRSSSWRRSTGSARRPSSRATSPTTVPPTVFFQPEITAFIKLFTKRVQLHQAGRSGGLRRRALVGEAHLRRRRAHPRGRRRSVQLSQYPSRFLNSLIVAVISTVLAVAMGTITAYGFSRFKMPGEDDCCSSSCRRACCRRSWSRSRCILMYRAVGLNDTHIGLIILYTAFNLSFSVWLMKGFMDEIPKEYEEAALVDGYTRHAGLLQDRAARGGDRHRRHRGVLLHHRLERIRLRADDDQPPRPDRAALHSRRRSARG